MDHVSFSALLMIERNQLEQLLVFHFRQEQVGAAFQQVLRELPLRFDELVDLLLHGSAAHELVHQHVLVLADAEGAVRGLVLHRRVPPAVEVHDVRGGGEVEARAAGLERKHEEPHGFVFLKAAHQFLALLHLGLAVQHQAGPPENRSEETPPAERSPRGTG